MSVVEELRECARRTRAQGSASMQVTTELNVPGGEDAPSGPLQGQVDFAADRWRLGVDTTEMMVGDGHLLYERRFRSNRWTRRRLADGRFGTFFDPRAMLALLVTGCESARATDPDSYRV